MCWKSFCLHALFFSLKIHINLKSVYSDVTNYKWVKLNCCQIDSLSCFAHPVEKVDSLKDMGFTQILEI